MIYKTNDWCSIIRDLGSKTMLATIGCTLNTENIFALLANAYLDFAQKIPSSTHHHQSNYLTAVGLGHSAIAVMHKIASKQFQNIQDLTQNQLLACSAEDSMTNLCEIAEKEKLI